MDFPVKADFFQPVLATLDEQLGYLKTVKSSVEAVRKVIKDPHWKRRLCKHKDVALSALYCIEDREELRSQAVEACPCLILRCSTYLNGTLNEALEALSNPRTDDFRKTMSFMHKKRFLDGLCLRTMLFPNENFGALSAETFASIKWSAFNHGKLTTAQKYPTGTDYCYIEYTGIAQQTFSNVTGKRNESEKFGFCIQESISRDREIPSLAAFGLHRGEYHRTGIIIVPTSREDVVQVYSVLQKRMLPDSSTDQNTVAFQANMEKAMIKQVTAIRKLDRLLERRRLSKLQFLKRDLWIKNEQRNSCAVCMKFFARLRRKHHCRRCGEVVCSNCAPLREIEITQVAALQLMLPKDCVQQVRICTSCSIQARGLHESACENLKDHSIHLHRVSRGSFVDQVRSTISSQSSSNSAGSVSSCLSLLSNDKFSDERFRITTLDNHLQQSSWREGIEEYSDDQLDFENESCSSDTFSVFDDQESTAIDASHNNLPEANNQGQEENSLVIDNDTPFRDILRLISELKLELAPLSHRLIRLTAQSTEGNSSQRMMHSNLTREEDDSLSFFENNSIIAASVTKNALKLSSLGLDPEDSAEQELDSGGYTGNRSSLSAFSEDQNQEAMCLDRGESTRQSSAERTCILHVRDTCIKVKHQIESLELQVVKDIKRHSSIRNISSECPARDYKAGSLKRRSTKYRTLLSSLQVVVKLMQPSALHTDRTSS